MNYWNQYLTSDKKESFDIQDMSCASCAQTIEENLLESDFVEEVNVNFADDRAIVEYHESSDRRDIVEVVENSGYTVLRI